MAEKLFLHENKVLQLIFIPLNVTVFFHIQKNKIHFSGRRFANINSHFSSNLNSNSDSDACQDQAFTDFKSKPNAVIQGTILDLTALMLSNKPGMPNSVSVTGDMHFVQDFKRVFHELDIDKEEILSRFTGDYVAYSISKVFNFIKNIRAKTTHAFKRNLKDYLEEESRAIVSRAEAEDFYHDIDKIKHDTERLSAKIYLLTLRLHESKVPRKPRQKQEKNKRTHKT